MNNCLALIFPLGFWGTEGKKGKERERNAGTVRVSPMITWHHRFLKHASYQVLWWSAMGICCPLYYL